MNLRLLASAMIAGACSLATVAQNPWLHIYRSDSKFHSVELDSVASLSIAPDNGSDAASAITLSILGQDPVLVPVSAFDHFTVSPNVASFYINTNEWIDDVHDKKTEYPATITIRSNGFPGMEDIDGAEFKLRGRGNSTLGFPKKPYRLKFSKKIAVHSDLRKAKNYVLLANYIDNSLMRNSVAFKVAQLLDMPYTPHGIPVNLWLNGEYRGSYLLCEKTGINAGNIHDIEDTEGVLLELDTNVDPSDTYFDDGKGNTAIAPFYFPVAIKDPDFAELEEDGSIASADSAKAAWRQKFDGLTFALAGQTGEDWADHIDLESAVRYIMTFHFCGNLELKHPKSCFMHAKTYDSKFEFGPIWDFDWAFTYDGYEGAQRPDIITFGGSNGPNRNTGARFFQPIFTDARFLKRFGEVWEEFKEQKLPELLDYFDEYAATIEPTAALNGEHWPPEKMTAGAQSSTEFAASSARLRQWLIDRAEFISTAPNFGLFEKSLLSGDVKDIPEGFTPVELTANMVTASDPDEEEGQIEHLFDNDPLTFYHSDWHSIKGHDEKYGSYIDITLPAEATEVVFDITSRITDDHSGQPDNVNVYVSADGRRWSLAGEAKDISKEGFKQEPGASVRLGAFKAKTPFTHVRFAVTASSRGSLTSNTYPDFSYIPEEFREWLLQNYRTYWNLAEMRVYTK